jgi:hypothetical protein
MSFFEVREKNGQKKAQDLPFMVDASTVRRYGKLQHVQPQPREPSTKPIEACPPLLEQHVQLMHITKVIEENGKYLFKNQLLEEEQCFQENSRTIFVLEGVPGVRQDFHLVLEMHALITERV